MSSPVAEYSHPAESPKASQIIISGLCLPGYRCAHNISVDGGETWRYLRGERIHVIMSNMTDAQRERVVMAPAIMDRVRVPAWPHFRSQAASPVSSGKPELLVSPIIAEGFWYSERPEDADYPVPVATDIPVDPRVIEALTSIIRTLSNSAVGAREPHSAVGAREPHSAVGAREPHSAVGAWKPYHTMTYPNAIVTDYLGSSPCRLCDKLIGSAEYVLCGLSSSDTQSGEVSYKFSEGLLHYYTAHNVQPAPAFAEFIMVYKAAPGCSGRETPNYIKMMNGMAGLRYA